MTKGVRFYLNYSLHVQVLDNASYHGASRGPEGLASSTTQRLTQVVQQEVSFDDQSACLAHATASVVQ